MSYIEPNTDINLYTNTGLSPSYDNTLYFASEEEKNAYWGQTLMPAAHFTKCSYQREKRGFIRVETPIYMIFHCDYMRFKNTNFENKYFYAFILSINYINNTTCEIQYQLDPLMTWMGLIEFNDCLILRQHTTTDNFGENINDEGVQLGDYVIKSRHEAPEAEGMGICICVANENSIGSYVGGIYGAVEIKFFNSANEANEYINSLVENNLQDNIVSMFMCPAEFMSTSSNGKINTNVSFEITKSGALAGYTPKNKKCYTYPYTKFVVANGTGDEATYRPEFFNDGTYKFDILGSINTNAQLVCFPDKYKGIVQNTEESISKSDYPSCAWNYDSYKAWLAQYNAYYPQNADLLSQTLETRTGKTALNGLMSIFSGGVSSGVGQYLQEYNFPKSNYMGVGNNPILGAGMSAIGAGVNQVGNAVNNLLDKEQLARERKVYNTTQPMTSQVMKGKVVPNAMEVLGLGRSFWFYEKVQNPQNMKIIDDYFTMYGYTINTVGKPNMNARPHYTYVKTEGCNIKANIPVDSAHAIEQIFDNGIRFWKNLSEMGNYSLDNSPR